MIGEVARQLLRRKKWRVDWSFLIAGFTLAAGEWCARRLAGLADEAAEKLGRLFARLESWHETASGEPETCIRCGDTTAECDCTGGPLIEPECTCYEPDYGHQPGCAFYGRRRA